MSHTFLIEEGKWYTSGELFDEHEIEVPIAGHAFIEHQEGTWIDHSLMHVLTDEPLQMTNEYEIVPFPAGKNWTVWTAFNPALGRISGTFVVVGDSILSSYRSESGEYSGSEYFLKEDDNTYHSAGVLFRGDVKVSSWEAMLTREETE